MNQPSPTTTRLCDLLQIQVLEDKMKLTSMQAELNERLVECSELKSLKPGKSCYQMRGRILFLADGKSVLASKNASLEALQKEIKNTEQNILADLARAAKLVESSKLDV